MHRVVPSDIGNRVERNGTIISRSVKTSYCLILMFFVFVFFQCFAIGHGFSVVCVLATSSPAHFGAPRGANDNIQSGAHTLKMRFQHRLRMLAVLDLPHKSQRKSEFDVLMKTHSQHCRATLVFEYTRVVYRLHVYSLMRQHPISIQTPWTACVIHEKYIT